MGTNDARRGEHFVEEFSDLIVGEKITHESVWQRENSKQMENRELAEHRRASERVAARIPQRWLRYYVASKLRTDPVYPAAYHLLGQSSAPILDVGCGVGLLAFYLRERKCEQPIVGIDRDARKIRHALNLQARGGYRELTFRDEQVEKKLPDFTGNIALFDLLHYLPRVEQGALLSRLAESVAAGGVLLIRDAPRDRTPRFWMTYLMERFAQTISWNIMTPLHFPSRAEVARPFAPENFTREEKPMWGHTPFNNHLFIFRRRSSATVPVLG